MRDPGEAQPPDVGFKVLLIEDDVGCATVLAKRLSTSTNPRFSVEHADRLQQGLECLTKGGAEVVLLDLGLPDSDGLDTFVRMRTHAPAIPVVVFTGLDDTTLGLEAVRQGAQDYVVKSRVDGETLSRVLRYAIERHRMQAALRDLSLSDELTGLHNRRGFFTLARQPLALSRRTKQGLSLVFMDLDGLKRINDAHGHPEGDQALVAVAEVLKATFRESDVMARVGGDEFAVLAIGATSQSRGILLARLQAALRAQNEQRTLHAKPPLSLSAGVAEFDPSAPCTLEALLTRADQAMYHGKRGQGRPRRILVVEDDPTICTLLGYRLEQAGFDVVIAHDGQEGLESARRDPPDLLLLDLTLPTLPGEAVCKAIREASDPRVAQLPIIMLTAKATDVDRVIGRVIGANGYVAKPFSGEALLREIQRVMVKPLDAEPADLLD